MNAEQWAGTVQKWAVEIAMQEMGTAFLAPQILESVNELLRIKK